jgi:hypothetical protein
VDFTADEEYTVTPLIAGFADLLNKVASKGYNKWEVHKSPAVLGCSSFKKLTCHRFPECHD